MDINNISHDGIFLLNICTITRLKLIIIIWSYDSHTVINITNEIRPNTKKLYK